jgi:hypothetical protein
MVELSRQGQLKHGAIEPCAHAIVRLHLLIGQIDTQLAKRGGPGAIQETLATRANARLASCCYLEEHFGVERGGAPKADIREYKST